MSVFPVQIVVDQALRLYMQRTNLSKRTSAILYNFNKLLRESNLQLGQLVVRLFQYKKERFRSGEFSLLIKQIDSRLTYEDIDHIWTELDPNGNGFVFLNDLQRHLNCITEEDNPFNNKLDRQSRIIIQNEQKGVSEPDQIILCLKQLKDMLKDTDPWQLLDLFDEDRDGRLNIDEFGDILGNFQVSKKKADLIVKGIFRGKRKCRFQDILTALGLQNVGKRVDFEDIPSDPNPIKNPALASSIRKSKIRIVDEKPKPPPNIQGQPVEFSEIPAIVHPHFNYSSVMTEPLMSLVTAQLISNRVYIDNDNPHSTKAHRWQHISKIFREGYYLFQNRGQSILARSKQRTGLGLMMDPNNVNQGEIGDCYLMSAVAGIVESYPELIYRLFVLDKNPVSMYAVRLFVDGIWQTIITDARFPVNFNGRFLYAKPYKHEIWVMVLEKAWAKLYKSYENINAGYSDEGLTAITGAPSVNFDTNQEGALQKTQFYISKGFIISCSGSENLGQMTDGEQQQMGIFSSHAYSVISIHPNLSWKGTTVTLIKVRNPWGKKGWKGDWSYSSGTWTNELRDKLKYNRDIQDGSFYMRLQDFMTYYDRLSVCFVCLKKLNSHIKLTSNRHNSVMVSFNVQKEGDYYFSIYQQNKRKYKSSGNYQLSKSRMFLGRLVNGQIEAVSSKANIKSNLHLESTLTPGNYIISCKVRWNYKESNSFNLTSYGPEPIHFNEIPKDKNFIRQFIESRSRLQIGTKSFYSKQPMTTSFKIIKIEPKQGYGYIFVRNNSQHMLNTTITLTNVKGLKTLKPEKLPFELFVPPQSDVTRALICDSEGYAYQMSEQYSLQ